MGSPRVRAVSVAALVLVLGAVLMPYLFRLLLPLPEWLYEALLLSYLGGATLVTLVIAAVSWVALWPATPYLDLRPGEPEPQGADPREAKEALQAFPGRLALAGTAAGELLTATGWLALLFAGLPLALVLSLSLTTAVVVALLWMLLHALGQSAVEPHLLRLREVPVPLSSEAGTAVAARTGATLLLIVLSGTVPAAVFANAFVERQQDQHARNKRRMRLSVHLEPALPSALSSSCELLRADQPRSSNDRDVLRVHDERHNARHVRGRRVLLDPRHVPVRQRRALRRNGRRHLTRSIAMPGVRCETGPRRTIIG